MFLTLFLPSPNSRLLPHSRLHAQLDKVSCSNQGDGWTDVLDQAVFRRRWAEELCDGEERAQDVVHVPLLGALDRGDFCSL